MPSVYFYAAQADIAKLLTFVFEETDCRVYEAYSEPGQSLRQFVSPAETLAAYPLDHAGHRASPAQLVLWSPRTGPEPTQRRIELRPGALEEASHRSVLEAWGLIQLLASGIRDQCIECSRLAYNSEARARAWEETSAVRFGPVEAWDWVAVGRLAGRLTYHVRRRLAVGKHGSRSILPAAQAARESGLQLA